MKKIFIFSVFLSIFLIGCAEPKYVEIKQSAQNVQAESADCTIKFSQSQTCLSWYWEKLPTSTETGSIIFKTYRLNQFDRSSVEINMPTMPELILWMPSMNHGSSPTTVEYLDFGTYRADEIFFVMPGEWECKFQIKNQGVVADEAVVHFNF